MINVEQFTEEVLSRLVAEHGAPRSSFEYLIPKIAAAYDTEHGITSDQLGDMIHGEDVAESDVLEKQFPLLNAICLSPYTEVDHSSEVEKVDEDDEDDEDDDEPTDDDDEED